MKDNKNALSCIFLVAQISCFGATSVPEGTLGLKEVQAAFGLLALDAAPDCPKPWSLSAAEQLKKVTLLFPQEGHPCSSCADHGQNCRTVISGVPIVMLCGYFKYFRNYFNKEDRFGDKPAVTIELSGITHENMRLLLMYCCNPRRFRAHVTFGMVDQAKWLGMITEDTQALYNQALRTLNADLLWDRRFYENPITFQKGEKPKSLFNFFFPFEGNEEQGTGDLARVSFDGQYGLKPSSKGIQVFRLTPPAVGSEKWRREKVLNFRPPVSDFLLDGKKGTAEQVKEELLLGAADLRK